MRRREKIGSCQESRLDGEARDTFAMALRNLCPRLERFLARRVSTLVPSYVEREDIVQEALLRTIDNLARGAVDIQRPLWPYLVGTAIHVLSECRRSAHRRGRLARLLSGGAEAVPGPRADAVWLAMALRDVGTWVQKQPSPLGAVWSRCVLDSEGQREVARELGMSRRRLRVLESELYSRLLSALSGASANSVLTPKQRTGMRAAINRKQAVERLLREGGVLPAARED